MKTLTLALMLLSAIAFGANKDGAGQNGNGGGGVRKNGRLMTFYSAGLYTDPTPEGEHDIPNLKELTNYVSQLNFLSAQSKSKLISAIIPTSSREYYRVQEDRFDKATRDRIVHEFADVTHAPTADIEIFAVTDTNARRTFLLPGFYSLRPTEQMAILFHEAYWLLNPGADYDKVVSAEVNFQAMVENPNDVNKASNFLRYFGTDEDVFSLALKNDIAKKSLAGLLNKNNQVALSTILGNDYIACLNAGSATCANFLPSAVFKLSQSYPNSMLVNLLLDKVSNTQDFVDQYNGSHHTPCSAVFWGQGENAEPVSLCKVQLGDFPSYYDTGNDVFGHNYHRLLVQWNTCVVTLSPYTTMGNPSAYGLPVQCSYDKRDKMLNAYLRF